MKVLVTGAAGFIGSHVVDRLLARGDTVIGVDNFSTGRREFLRDALHHKRFRLVKRDLLNPRSLHGVLTNDVDWVIHLSANADVRWGLSHPERDLQQNSLVTFYLLEAMRIAGVRNLVFSSTGSVYGETRVVPTPEDAPFPIQTSLYGASKLAAESLISAYAEGFQFHALVFRFVSILGERYSHGHVFDFVKQLREHPTSLKVLGNGKQRKSYLYVHDCIDAIFAAMKHRWEHRVELINLGTDEYVNVNQSIGVICRTMHVSPRLTYGGGDRGWIGDNPFIFLKCSKIRSIGWRPRVSIRDGVRRTVDYLLAHPGLMNARRK